MNDYKPSTIVMKLCEKLHETPIKERIELDGTVVIIFADGRKRIFGKDDITRTLTEPAIANPETPGLEDAGQALPMVGRSPTTKQPVKRKQKGQ
jgi:hypothetical protein